MKSICKFVVVFILGCISTFVIILSFAGPGSLDWEYKLPNNYAVWHINSNDILINYVGSEQHADEIPSFVKEFSYDERYVFTRNVESIECNNVLDEKYYILDTEEKKVYDSCNSVNELIKLSKQLEIEIPIKWYRTSPDPNFDQ